ncbi:ABC transporter permease [Xanthocytophaga flava]|uniref:ABC transporter permease n=1 Tax=Xanthocytophaga flava TaxID=3048013 RepID=UPI0028D2C037|nr:ABC transporter permease [Xanthocytophaga flavus]MDJ1473183.1 ABC transporter permease [Xanthocytophaga flavus]
MLRNYFKIALRNLQRHRTYATINVLGLALGITCSILIFAMIKYHLSFDTFHTKADRIYRMVTEFHGEEMGYTQGVPAPAGKAFREDFTFAEKVARVTAFHDALISIPSSKTNKKFEEEAGVAFTEPQYFDILDFPFLEGDKKTALTQPNSAVITQKLADKYFPGENAIGKVIRFDNKLDFKITGILQDLPPNTDRRHEIFLSYSNLKDQSKFLAADDSWGGVYSDLQCFVLLKPGVTEATVEKALPGMSKKYYKGKDATGFQFRLQPIADIHFNPNMDGYVEKKNLWALAWIGVFLIITACVNFVNLATAQALNRSKEVGVRKVLGSQPAQLFWQFISETALISFVAILIAYLLANLALPYINGLFESQLSINLFQDIYLSVFLFILLGVVIFLSGSYPGLVLAGFQPILALKGKISQKHVGGFSLRRILVVSQFAISQALIIGTIVIANQMRYSKESDLGFTKESVVMLPVPVSDKVKMNTLRTRLSEVSGVNNVSFCFQAPAATSNNNTDIRYDNRPEGEKFGINRKDADDQYVTTFGLKLVAGRNIFPSDTAREFLVNEIFVKKLSLKSPQDVIGKPISVNGDHQKGIIVGVVNDFYNYSFRTDISPICIMSVSDMYNNCAVKIHPANIKSTLAAMEKVWNETYPEYVYSHSFLDEKIAEFYALDDIMLQLIQAFAGIAIFIGCLGLYGLVSFMAAQKTKEIGIRKVLGATTGHVLWLFGKEFVRLIAIAFVIAAPLAWWTMNSWLQDFKYKVSIGPDIFGIAIGFTVLIATLTVSYRSVKVALMNPTRSLRSE